MSKNQPLVKKKLLKELERVPIVELACQRVGISRSTFYRWLEADDEFSENVAASLEKGVDKVNDMAESKLITSIKENKHPAIVFWLRNNHPKYQPRSKSTLRKRSMWERQPVKAIVEFIGDK